MLSRIELITLDVMRTDWNKKKSIEKALAKAERRFNAPSIIDNSSFFDLPTMQITKCPSLFTILLPSVDPNNDNLTVN